jgi:hypothetical protein
MGYMITFVLLALSIPANCIVHRFRRGRWYWTWEDNFWGWVLDQSDRLSDALMKGEDDE